MNQKKLIRLLLLFTLIAGTGLAITFRSELNAASLEQWMQEAGPAAPFIFIAIYALGCVLFLPGSVLTLAGGALFGPVLGTLYNLTGATAGAVLAFLTARYLASEWVERKTEGRLKQIMNGVESEGWRFVAFVRLVPLFPFNLLNYALGLTRIKLAHYVVASYFCMFPGALAYTYLGYAGREALKGAEGLIQKGLLALGLLALVVFIPRFVRRMHPYPPYPMMSTVELKRRLDRGEAIVVLDVRSTAEFTGEIGHIPGALNIGMEELPGRVSELEKYRNRQVAIVCHTDKRSAKAANILRDTGFSTVTVIRGGMKQWHRNGMPVEKEKGTDLFYKKM
ncbi:MAG: VTT domain-containing protein [Nitrospirae bacterium]|nr:VTT domain-containing protein [Nitrospirota bacterium]